MNGRVLIVEDEAIIAQQLETRLLKIGYEVVDIVDNSEDAISSLSINPADVVLMDIIIKGAEDGIDTAIRLQNTYDLPVIFLTAYSDEKTLRRAELAYAYGYLVKPVTERELEATIRTVLNRHKRDQELLKTISEVETQSGKFESMVNRLTRQVKNYSQVKTEDEVRYALEEEQFILHYQPQVNIRTQQIAGMEALLRWEHPARGLMPPDSFIPCLEETGMIRDVGDWVMDTACQQLHQWAGIRSENLTMSVNLSGKQIKPVELENTLSHILTQYQLKPKNIDLEVTETVIVDNLMEEIEVFENLRVMGVRLSIDDFGTGYSGLSYLQNFPFDVIKIDRQFIHNIESNNKYSSILVAIINLAQELGMQTVAEGVETETELKFLQEHGCDIAQGYYYSPAVPAKEITKLLEAGPRFSQMPV
jgi:EAL domain-containing protein (putative c-di-GMP-specific phosphodiesterase class I)/AmiR/NasT family two-component response regulator